MIKNIYKWTGVLYDIANMPWMHHQTKPPFGEVFVWQYAVRRELAGKQVRLQAKAIRGIAVGKADERSADRNEVQVNLAAFVKTKTMRLPYKSLFAKKRFFCFKFSGAILA
jgi:hypothetical protein